MLGRRAIGSSLIRIRSALFDGTKNDVVARRSLNSRPLPQHLPMVCSLMIGRLYHQEIGGKLSDDSLETSIERISDHLMHNVKPGTMSSHAFWRAGRVVLELAKESRAPDKAERMLERLEREVDQCDGHMLNPTLYGACMDSWARSGDDQCGERAEALLERMQARHDLNPTRSPAPNHVVYNNVMFAWANSPDKNAPERVEVLLEKLEEKSKVNPSFRPNAAAYDLLILAYANRVGEYGSAKAAEDILFRVSSLHTEGIHLSTRSFNIVLKAWANSGDDRGPERALEILRLMIRLNTEGHDNILPSEVTFSTVIHAFAIQGAAEKAEEILTMAEQFDFPSKTNLTTCFNATMDAWAKSGNREAGRRAEFLLHQGVDSGKLVPDYVTYATCLQAHAKSNIPEAPECAEAFLRQMINASRSASIRVKPDSGMFRSAIKIWVRSNREDAAARADALLIMMEELAKTQPFQYLSTDSYSYNMVIDAWCRKQTPDGRERALFLLERLERASARLTTSRPSSFAYRRVICSLVRSKDLAKVKNAYSILRRMESKAHLGQLDHPLDIRAYNSVVAGLARSGNSDAVSTAVALLRHMEDLYLKGNESMAPDKLSYVGVIYGLRRLNNQAATETAVRLFRDLQRLEDDASRLIKIDGKLVRDVLQSLAQIKGDWVARETLDIYTCAENRFEERGIEFDPTCLEACIRAISTSRNVVIIETVHNMLERQIDRYIAGKSPYFPPRESFHAMLYAWSNSSSKESRMKALGILGVMKSHAINGVSRVEPNCATYARVISVLAKERTKEAAQEAERLALSLEGGSSKSRREKRIDTVVWNAVLLAWSRVNSDDKARQAKRVLDDMKVRFDNGTSNSRPDIYSYNTVLNAAAFSNGGAGVKQEAIRVATKAFSELKNASRLKPDDITYGTMIKVYRTQTSDGEEQRAAIRGIVNQCVDDQKVGRLVVSEVEKTVGIEDLTKRLT